eukprot:COSAG01_NODE_476_length_16515_cov_37.730690_15_plen_208_part_00
MDARCLWSQQRVARGAASPRAEGGCLGCAPPSVLRLDLQRAAGRVRGVRRSPRRARHARHDDLPPVRGVRCAPCNPGCFWLGFSLCGVGSCHGICNPGCFSWLFLAGISLCGVGSCHGMLRAQRTRAASAPTTPASCTCCAPAGRRAGGGHWLAGGACAAACTATQHPPAPHGAVSWRRHARSRSGLAHTAVAFTCALVARSALRAR